MKNLNFVYKYLNEKRYVDIARKLKVLFIMCLIINTGLMAVLYKSYRNVDSIRETINTYKRNTVNMSNTKKDIQTVKTYKYFLENSNALDFQELSVDGKNVKLTIKIRNYNDFISSVETIENNSKYIIKHVSSPVKKEDYYTFELSYEVKDV